MTHSYVQCSAAAQNTGLEGQQVRKIFSSVSEAGTVLRSPVNQMNGVFMALQQMISKGKVMSNMLKFHSGGVVGEEIPILARKGEAVFTRDKCVF